MTAAFMDFRKATSDPAVAVEFARIDATLEAEIALLGLLLAEPSAIHDAERLQPEDFYSHDNGPSFHGRVFQALRELDAQDLEPDLHALSARFAEDLRSLGDPAYLHTLVAKCGTLAGLPSLVGEIATGAAQRRLARAGTYPGLTAEDLAEILNREQRRVDGLGRRRPIRATPFTFVDPATIPPRSHLYGKHYTRKFVSATFSPGGVGKSSAIAVEALAMATGRALHNVFPRGPLTVWSINLEDPQEETARKLAAACKHFGISSGDIDGRLYVDSGRDDAPVVVAKATRGGIEVCAPVVRQIEREIIERGIDVLIIDPFVDCHEVPENDNSAVSVVVRQWRGIADRTGCAIELVHHVRKASPNQTEVTVEDGRGAGALLAGVRSARVLNVMSEKEAADWGIENRRLFFRMDTGKANLAKPSDKASWFRLVSVDLENAPSGFSDEVGVVVPWTPPNPQDGVSDAEIYGVQQLVEAGDYRVNEQAAHWVGHAVAAVLLLDLADPKDKARAKALLKTWFAKGLLKTEMRTDPGKRELKPFAAVGKWVQP